MRNILSFIMHRSILLVLALVSCQQLRASRCESIFNQSSKSIESTQQLSKITMELMENGAHWLVNTILSRLMTTSRNTYQIQFITDILNTSAELEPSVKRTLSQKIISKRKLNDSEYDLVSKLILSAYREAAYQKLLAKKVRLNPLFKEQGWEYLTEQNNKRSFIWKKLGFKPIENKEHEFEIPTYNEVSKRLKQLQVELGIPRNKWFKLVFVQENIKDSKPVLITVGDPLPKGFDIYFEEQFIPNKVFFEMIINRQIPISNGVHDISHLVAFLKDPAYFDAISNLFKQNIEKINKEGVLEDARAARVSWASEFLIHPVSSKGLLSSSLLEKGLLNNLSPRKVFEKIKKEIEKATPLKLEEYVNEKLIPSFEQRFVPLGGGQENFGERERNFEDPHAMYRRRTKDFQPPPSMLIDGMERKHNNLYIGLEQPINLLLELKYVMEMRKFENKKEKEKSLQSMVAILEFTLIELSQISQVEVIQILGSTARVRQDSRLASILEVIRGRHSAVYMALVAP